MVDGDIPTPMTCQQQLKQAQPDRWGRPSVASINNAVAPTATAVLEVTAQGTPQTQVTMQQQGAK